MNCSETYYPEWSSRGLRGVKCNRPAKLMALRHPFANPEWAPVCGIHARLYEKTRPIVLRPEPPKLD